MGQLRLGRSTRKFFVFVHVVVSVGWMGAGAANIVLAAVARSSVDLDTAGVCYRLIVEVDHWLVIPAAFAALVTGILLSVLTPWGLTRHWWVLVKLVLTVVVIVASTIGVGLWVELSLERIGAGEPSPYGGRVVLAASANMVAFLLMNWASVAKPWGTTPWAGTRRPRRVAPVPARAV